MKKILIAVAMIGIFGMTSCAYKTCPTYAKQDAPVAKQRM